jgi:DNA-binding SARP family transcriptional activator
VTTPTSATGAPALRLIGGFRVSVDGTEISTTRSEQRLLALLALRGGDNSRATLADRLWPDAKRDPKANLRGVVLRLDERIRAHVLVRSDTLELASTWDVDVRTATNAARCLDGDEAPGSHWALADLFCADLLPDWDEWWLHGERECFRQLRLHALERLAARALQAGRPDQAIEYALRAVDAEPLRESAQYLLISGYFGEGNRASGVEQFRRFAKQLDAELAVAPSRALADLVHEALQR